MHKTGLNVAAAFSDSKPASNWFNSNIFLLSFHVPFKYLFFLKGGTEISPECIFLLQGVICPNSSAEKKEEAAAHWCAHCILHLGN